MKQINAPGASRSALIHSVAAIIALAIAAAGRTLPVTSIQQSLPPQEILAAAAEKGKQILEELQSYSYYAELTIQTVSQADVITGKYYRFSRVYYDSNGTRQERVFEDKSTLPKEVFIGTNAINNMTRVYRFMVTPESFSEYEFNYVGRERVDELNTYVFDVNPTVKLPNPEKSRDRYLKGRIWIDDRDLQVVKVAGQAVPEQSAHKTPRFESYFQNYDKYWFPAFMSADDEIRVGNRRTRVVVELRFTRYKKEQGND